MTEMAEIGEASARHLQGASHARPAEVDDLRLKNQNFQTPKEEIRDFLMRSQCFGKVIVLESSLSWNLCHMPSHMLHKACYAKNVTTTNRRVLLRRDRRVRNPRELC
jgi:hypothetical protein